MDEEINRQEIQSGMWENAIIEELREEEDLNSECFDWQQEKDNLMEMGMFMGLDEE